MRKEHNKIFIFLTTDIPVMLEQINSQLGQTIAPIIFKIIFRTIVYTCISIAMVNNPHIQEIDQDSPAFEGSMPLTIRTNHIGSCMTS